MAEPQFFDGGQLPEDFNHAASDEINDRDAQDPEEPHLRYNPPELVPTPGGSQISEIAREELNSSARDAIDQARDRMERGETELGDPAIADDFERAGWSSLEIEEVANEDRDRGQHGDDEWDEQAQREYERWSMDESARQYQDRWGDREDVESYESYGDYERSLMDQIPDRSQDLGSDFEH